MAVDPGVIKMLIDDELQSNSNRQIKALGLRSVLKAICDWVGSVAGVAGPQGPQGPQGTVWKTVLVGNGELVPENGSTYIIKSGVSAYFISPIQQDVPLDGGLGFTVIKEASAGFSYTYPVNGSDIIIPKVAAAARNGNVIGQEISFSTWGGMNSYGFPQGVTNVRIVKRDASTTAEMYVW